MSITISDSAAKRILALREQKNQPNLHLRVGVAGGGCSGFQYDMTVEDAPLKEGDQTFEHEGASVVVDTVSLPFLKGSEVDYVQELGQSRFEVKNPNASAQCGCGSSFSIDMGKLS